MIVRYLLAALAAGLFAGILMTPVQYKQTVPIILHAEEFEGEGGHNHAAAQAGHTHEDGTAHAADHEPVAAPANATAGTAHAAEPPLLLGRFWNTLFSNIVAGAGFALLMMGVSLVSGVTISFATGLAWGAAGWLAVQFLPGLGLPPELPGFPFVDVAQRQIWWVATVAASIAGLWLIFVRKEFAAKAGGFAFLVAPHLYGAPQPADISSKVPAFLAAEYVMAALATTLFFWLALGLLLGFFMDRSGKAV